MHGGVKMIKLAKAQLGLEELSKVQEAFNYGYFGLAYNVQKFEQDLAQFIGSSSVVAVNTGTSALHLALEACGITSGDEVIVPSLTFVASFQAITQTGAKPIACEVDPDTLLIDIEDVKRRITSKTKAIMPVHYGGSICDMDILLKLKEDLGIRIIEDAAHAIGSIYKGKMVGSFGDITCFSFDSIKTITCGEGGAIVCHDPQLDKNIRQKRLLGISRETYSKDWRERGWFYQVEQQGFRYHMSNINAAIGIVQLKKIREFIQCRRNICTRYIKELSYLPWIEVRAADYNSIAPFIFVIKVKNGLRDNLMAYLKENMIESGVNYIPNHMQPFYRDADINLPVTEQIFNEILTLPLHCDLTDQDVDKVIQTIKSFQF